MGAIVVFDYAAWTARFPEFASVPQATAQAYFNEAGAGIYWSNTGSSPIDEPAQQAVIMNLLTAHLAAMARASTPLAGDSSVGPAPAPMPTGRISSASEGSVSVSFDMPSNLPVQSAWYAQTAYGFQAWQIIAQFRTAVYVPGPTYNPDPYSFMVRQWPQ